MRNETEPRASRAGNLWRRLNRDRRDWLLRRRARRNQRLLDAGQPLGDNSEEPEDSDQAATDVYSWLSRRDNL